jgi:hypothetical protein
MAKFTCPNDGCIKANREETEDIRLHLIVEEGTKTEYYMNNDGSLEIYDAEGIGQTIKIECPICGQEYELDEPYGYYEVQEKHSLPFSKTELKEMKLLKVNKTEE